MEDDRRIQDDRRILARRAFLFGVPFLYLVLGVLHPNPDPGFGDDTGLFIGLHVAQLFLIGGLAYSLWLLVDGIESRAARIARALILPYAITYAAFDAVAGIAMGTVVREANAAPAADQAAAERLIDALRVETWDGYLFYFTTALIWLAAALAVVIALKKSAPRPALVLMGLGAAVFAVGHPQPTGPIGMALFIAGVAWLELRPRSAEAREPVSAEVQPT
jgi:cytochrome bd-type quinol oxidase subunit 2